MTKKRILLWLLAVMALASFFRLWQIGSVPPGLYSDEAMNGNNALEALTTGKYKVFYAENNGREGLFINIIALSIKIFGNNPLAVRAPSALFGILTVLGLYLLTRELFSENPKSQTCPPASAQADGRRVTNHKQYQNSNVQNSKQFRIWDFGSWNLFRISSLESRAFHGEKIALLSSFFLAVSFWHINFSRIGFRAIMAPAFLVWSFWLLWRALNLGNSVSKSAWKRSFQVILGGLLYGLGFYSYIAYRITPVFLIFPLIMALKKPRPRKRALAVFTLFLTAAFFAALPLGLYFLKNPADFLGRTSQISVFESENPALNLFKNIFLTLQMFFFVGDFNWRHNFAGSPQLWLPVALLFLIGFLAGLKKMVKNPAGPESFLMVWFFAGLVPVAVSNEGLPHALRALVVIPAVMIFAGWGLLKILQKTSPKLSLLILAALIISLPLQAYHKYFIQWAKNENVARAFNEDLKNIADELNKTPPDIPKYIIMENADRFDFRGRPMSAQPIMFLTGTFLPQWQKEKKFFYLPAKEAGEIPEKAKAVWID